MKDFLKKKHVNWIVGSVSVLVVLGLSACASSTSAKDDSAERWQSQETVTGSMLKRQAKPQAATPEEAAAMQDQLRQATTLGGAAPPSRGGN